MKNSLRAVIFALILTVATTPLAALPASAAASTVNSPDHLIRSATHGTLYYLGVDGLRYVFPNQETYDTWYHNTRVSIPELNDYDLGLIQIGGNVTYKPGSTLVKIPSDTRIYAIDQGSVLRNLTTPEAATALFGEDWQSNVTEIEEIYFGNYTIGAPIETAFAAERYAANLARARVASIDVDKALLPSLIITVNERGYDRLQTTVEAGQRIKFVNVGTAPHTVTSTSQDWSTGTLNPGESFTRIFTKPGTIRLFDAYAPQYSSSISTVASR